MVVSERQTAIGTNTSYGITQCYLPSDSGNIPALNPSRAGTRFSDPRGCKAELTWLAGYTPRWYTRPNTVTHFDTNRTRRRATSFIRRTTLTTHCTRGC